MFIDCILLKYFFQLRVSSLKQVRGSIVAYKYMINLINSLIKLVC